MKYLFWNTQKNEDINDVLCELIIENDISIIMLAEYNADKSKLINELGAHGVNIIDYSGCSERIKMFGRTQNAKYGTDSDHSIIRVFNEKDIVCCVHLNSKIYSGHEDKREIIVEQIVKDIENAEETFNTKNTIVVGDFNSNPYERCLSNARYIWGIPVYEEARREKKTIEGQNFNMFYNPMWNLLGDFQKPYGTYYYAGTSTNNLFWNMFDQVMIRPTLKKRFKNEELKILTETKTRFLLDKKGHPNKKISDHLPIIFEIMEE